MVKKHNKGLGRGIDALFNSAYDEDSLEAIEEINHDEESVVILKVSDIRPNPYQPRQLFDETSLQELADSITENGVFQPIIVRRSTIKGYDVIAGERRLRASKLAQKETIPAIIRDYNEETMIQIAVVENLQREDLNAIEEAKAYQTLMKELKLTQQDVAMRVGKSRPYIANFVRLLSLPVKTQTALEENQLSVGHARALLALSNERDIVDLTKDIIKKGLTVRQTEELIQTILDAPKQKPKRERKEIKKSPYILASEDRLMDKFGTSVSINPAGPQKDSGKIQIEYLSSSDLMRILDVLGIELDD
ncbi:MAG: ParB/RepB/Spo0J family partition protein [Bavariicoccus seileri]|uniref:ParB/RepB/Spo0J family partition protein n=1 Tax=Bavariicoccus seileri TaxID=549685 RepID=UPI0003B5E9D3|nr:ParB/RepB/Spo0J family partition protein [Bavariicoccus seileri]